MEPITPIADAIYSLGFPAAVAVVLLWFVMSNMDKKIDALGKQIAANTRAVTHLAIVLARAHGIDPDEMRPFVPGGHDESQ